MKSLKKFCAWEKTQMQKPETRMAIGMAAGVLIGIAMDNIAVGIVLGVALGVPGHASCKKKKKEDTTKTDGL